MTEAQKIAEGKILREKWLTYKAANPGMSQERFCEKIDITQGLLQQFFRGMTPIPLEILIEIAIEMGFDPREIRPELDRFLERLNKALSGSDNYRLMQRFLSLPDETREQAISYLLFLAEQSRPQ